MPAAGACLWRRWARPALAEPDADGDEARTLQPLQAAAITHRIAFGPRAGRNVLTLRGAMAHEAGCGGTPRGTAAARGASIGSVSRQAIPVQKVAATARPLCKHAQMLDWGDMRFLLAIARRCSPSGGPYQYDDQGISFARPGPSNSNTPCEI
jgi:hypothetical protein